MVILNYIKTITIADTRSLTDVYKEYFTQATVTQKLKAMLLQLQIQEAVNNIRLRSSETKKEKGNS